MTTTAKEAGGVASPQESVTAEPTLSVDRPHLTSLATTRANAEKARDALRAQVDRDTAEVERLNTFLRTARAELRRTERLLVAVDRIENPRKRGAKS